MRAVRCAALLLFLPLAALAAAGPNALEVTQRFAAAGAAQLALARVERLQPSGVTAPAWGDWETLRCSLLYQTKRHADLIKHVATLPASAAEKVKRSCLLQGARAGLAANDAGATRDFLSRLIWRHDPSLEEMRQWRRLVIDSYVNEGKAQDAYALMLRYQQDYRPVDSDTAARFVEALSAAGMDKEAVGWLSALDDASPAKLLVRLTNNLVSGDAAAAQARAQLAKSPNPAAWWQLLQQVALRSKNRTLEIEALEQLLQLCDEQMPACATALAGQLWKAYSAAAQDIANQNQILLGDEVVLSDLASRRSVSAPPLGRGLFAYLAAHSANTDTRYAGQLQLVHALASAKLGLVALRLYADQAQFPPAQLDTQARYLLGAIAAEGDRPQLAVRFWSGLDTPASLGTDEWQVRRAQVELRAGALSQAADSLRRALTGKTTLAPELMRQVIAAAQTLQDAGEQKTADELFATMLPVAAPPEKREILMRLGKAAESAKDPARAADCYLEAALLVEPTANDSFAWNARLQAMLMLDRAGLKDDARAQADWLQKNVQDAAQREMLRRELSKR